MVGELLPFAFDSYSVVLRLFGFAKGRYTRNHDKSESYGDLSFFYAQIVYPYKFPDENKVIY